MQAGAAMIDSVFAGDTTNAGNFIFPFVFPKAKLNVHMGSASVTGGNCEPTSVNGAGVALEELDIRTGTTCVAATISGITDEHNAATTEQTCTQFLCQDVTQQHIISGLAAGSYTIQIYGFKGATSGTPAICYISSPMSFSITTQDVNIGQIFVPFNDSMDTQHVCNATKPEE